MAPTPIAASDIKHRLAGDQRQHDWIEIRRRRAHWPRLAPEHESRLYGHQLASGRNGVGSDNLEKCVDSWLWILERIFPRRGSAVVIEDHQAGGHEQLPCKRRVGKHVECRMRSVDIDEVV